MNSQILSFTLEEVQREDSLLRKKSLFSHCLHYFPPTSGGWGIVRVGMLVPQSVMLFVAPPACGRHGAIAGLQLGFKDRLFYLYVDEMDIISGNHVDRVPEAVAEIMEAAVPPKALLICASCIDDLLGSDYEAVASELENEYGIPVRLCHMDPITLQGRTPPPLTIQKAIYSFLRRDIREDGAVNIIGNFTPVEEGSELYAVLASCGLKKIRQIGNCRTIGELEQMGGSACNILIRPEGKLAAEHLQNTLGIPYCYVPVAYGLHSILKNYNTLERFLGVSLELQEYEEEAKRRIAYVREKLGPLKIAVGSMTNANPFELSRALSEYGFDVKYIFCDEVLEGDMENIRWLAAHAPGIRILTNIHPGMPGFRREAVDIDLAVGFTAGYFCQCPRIVPLGFDVQPFGYGGVIKLLEMMLEAYAHPIRLKESLSKKAIII